MAGVALMAYYRIRRRWFKPWKYEYEWMHSGYGLILGYAWTKRSAKRRLAKAIWELVP